MSNVGLGVMIQALGGNWGADIMKEAVGKTISKLELADDELQFEMEDGSKFALFDNGQSCCETRWMSTDDDLQYYVGSVFQDVEVREHTSEELECGDKDMQFLVVKTSIGSFTMANHNEHNGYYGGFAVQAKRL